MTRPSELEGNGAAGKENHGVNDEGIGQQRKWPRHLTSVNVAFYPQRSQERNRGDAVARTKDARSPLHCNILQRIQ